MNKQKIIVYDYQDAIHGGAPWHHTEKDPVKYEVTAMCIADFRAYFMLNGKFCEAHGDDGFWHLVGSCHTHWLSDIKLAITSIEDTDNE